MLCARGLKRRSINVGRKLLANERVHERDDAIKSGDDQDICKNDRKSKAGSRTKEEEMKGQLVETLSTTVNHYFPKFNEWLRRLTDERNQGAVRYERQTIFWTALILMLTKRGSRKKITDEMGGEHFYENVRILSGQEDLERMPHGDTVEYLCMRLKEEELEEIEVKMIRSLLRSRALERYRLSQRYHTIAIDGCHVHSFDYEHCKQCLVQEDKNGNKRWFHMKLQASLVTPTGLCLGITSEWIENEQNYVKQDCELRAFYRMIKKIRRLYPRLPICVLLDALYAGQPTFELLTEERMQWIVVFKEGCMSHIYNWVMDVKRECGSENVIEETEEQEIEKRERRSHEERLARGATQNSKRVQVKKTTYSWMAGIEYDEDRNKFNIMTCKEEVDGHKTCDYVWLVSDGLNLNENTVKQLAQRGRCRWKIENEGINIQKNGGYQLKHLYSKDEVSIKIWIKILDLAHLINQLIEKGSLINIKTIGSIRNIAQRMFEHFCYFTFQKSSSPPRIQIRLTWDTS